MEISPENPTILVMDDEEDVRFIAEIMINRMGYGVDFAVNGHKALEMYKEALSSGRRYPLVILDLNIPGGMGGLELIGRLFEIDPETTAYVSCGNPYDPIMEAPEKFGFKGAISKPYLTEHLQLLFDQIK